MTMLPTTLVVPIAQSAAKSASEIGVMMVLLLAALAVALAGMTLLASFRSLRGTTLLAPAVWVFFSLAVLVLCQALLLRAPTDRPTREKFDLLVATSTLCPIVALLGAKRPQIRPWGWIVLSAWVVAALPAVESLVVHPNDWVDVHPFYMWLYAILVLLGCVNYLPTRFFGPAVLAAMGQCALLCDFLPGGAHWIAPLRKLAVSEILPEVLLSGRSDYRLWEITAGIVPLAGAICWAGWIARRKQSAITCGLGEWNRVWADFRNAYGLVWSMRVIERLLVLSYGVATPVRLTWSGFVSSSAASAASHATPMSGAAPVAAAPLAATAARLPEPLEHDFCMLLLRFVSSDWIRRRLGLSRLP